MVNEGDGVADAGNKADRTAFAGGGQMVHWHF